MLWRVRTTMSDRPGSLAAMATACGERGVNILGLQIFPGIGGVTDELVLRAPEEWGTGEVAALVEDAGGIDVSVAPCTEHALVDGPTQYLHALRRLAYDPSMLGELLARLLGAQTTPRPGSADDGLSLVQDSLMVDVGPHRVELRRTAPFTATEHARAIAFAEVAAELLGPVSDGPDGIPLAPTLDLLPPVPPVDGGAGTATADPVAEIGARAAGRAQARTDRTEAPTAAAPAPGLDDVREAPPEHPAAPAPAPRRAGLDTRAVTVRAARLEDVPALQQMHGRCSTDSVYRRYATPLAVLDDRLARRLLATGGGSLVACSGQGEVVATAALSACRDGVVDVALLVEDGWQRQGVGTRLLSAAARLARGRGAHEVVLRSEGHSPALMSLAFASGLRARIRLEGDTVLVTVGVAGLKPLAAVVDGFVPGTPSR